MPSIPQSLLWISLVVLWLFVLVPMLINKRDAVRRTSDVALATRVLNSGRSARLLRRRAPAAGHAWGYSRSEGLGDDADWQESDDDVDGHLDQEIDDEIDEEPAGTSVVRAAVVDIEDRTESEYLDVDVIGEDSGALPVGESAADEVDEVEEPDDQTDELTLEFDDAGMDQPADEVPDELPADAPADAEPRAQDDSELDGSDDEYEYVDDSSGLEAPSEADLQVADSLSAARRRRHESKTAAAVSARKYKFRKRMLTVMAAVLAGTALASATVAPTLWWTCGAVGVVTFLYLAYLRRQTRIEERLRRRRAKRIARARLGVENTDDREFDVVPSRLRRPGSVVLEIDDEDPIFEHLDYTPFARQFDLPHAAGQ